MEISKELLSEIMQLGILEVGEIDDCYLSFKYYILDDDFLDACINIYELAHKCKEWADSIGYILYSAIHGYECYIDGRSFIDNTPVRFLAESEPEAIFKACQWILTKDSK